MKSDSILEIKNLKIEIDDRLILSNINLNIIKGKINVLVGKNGSGKSTLVNAIMGNPKYKLSSGKIKFEGKDITNLKPNEKAKKGIFVSFQNPQEVSGLSFFKFLRESYNLLNDKKISILEFKEILERKSKELNISKHLLERYLNEGFSGGEKKKFEMLQMLVLNPKLAILDEIDSGLDIDSIKVVSKEINNFVKKGKTVLLITHYNRMLKDLNPSKVFVISEGKIIKEGNKKIIDILEKKGYEYLIKN